MNIKKIITVTIIIISMECNPVGLFQKIKSYFASSKAAKENCLLWSEKGQTYALTRTKIIKSLNEDNKKQQKTQSFFGLQTRQDETIQLTLFPTAQGKLAANGNKELTIYNDEPTENGWASNPHEKENEYFQSEEAIKSKTMVQLTPDISSVKTPENSLKMEKNDNGIIQFYCQGKGNGYLCMQPFFNQLQPENIILAPSKESISDGEIAAGISNGKTLVLVPENLFPWDLTYYSRRGITKGNVLAGIAITTGIFAIAYIKHIINEKNIVKERNARMKRFYGS